MTDWLTDTLAKQENWYVEAQALAKVDPEFKAKADAMTVRLQQRDPHIIARWHALCVPSAQRAAQVYRRLGMAEMADAMVRYWVDHMMGLRLYIGMRKIPLADGWPDFPELPA